MNQFEQKPINKIAELKETIIKTQETVRRSLAEMNLEVSNATEKMLAAQLNSEKIPIIENLVRVIELYLSKANELKNLQQDLVLELRTSKANINQINSAQEYLDMVIADNAITTNKCDQFKELLKKLG